MVTRNAFDDRESKQINMSESIHIICFTFTWDWRLIHLNMLLLCPVTSAGVERANTSLRYTKNVYRSTMLEERLNALILLFVHGDIHLDYDKIINMYSTKHPKRMLFVNALAQ